MEPFIRTPDQQEVPELTRMTFEQLPRELNDMIWKHYQAASEHAMQKPQTYLSLKSSKGCPFADFVVANSNPYTRPCNDYPCALLEEGSPIRDEYSPIYYRETHFRFVSPQHLLWFLKQLRAEDVAMLREISLSCIVALSCSFPGHYHHGDRITAGSNLFYSMEKSATEAFGLLQRWATRLKRLIIYVGVWEWPFTRCIASLKKLPGEEALGELRGLDYFSIQEDSAGQIDWDANLIIITIIGKQRLDQVAPAKASCVVPTLSDAQRLPEFATTKSIMLYTLHQIAISTSCKGAF
ncbi:MAG: hypothetical protein Q9181_002330 [Wetmoreana brouardii]